EAEHDGELKHILNNALLTTPDGMPMVWMGRLEGKSRMRRVYGPDLMLNLCDHGRAENFSHFLYGGAEGAADELASNLRKRFPGLRIVGTYTPPFRPLLPNELAELQAQVQAARPDFFWVGLSTPKQEKFMSQYLSLLPDATIMLGVGAAFDLLSGRVKQAPRWMQRSGLEWFYRWTQEPRRLTRRYFVNNPRFILAAVRQLMRS
ncbi:MAG TPA: WecB/TagA/CpsF family glycosyltransferase, partial [Chthoniobacterales bacterium]